MRRYAGPVMVAAVALIGCGQLPLPEAEITDSLDPMGGPEPEGPIVEVATGEVDGETWWVVAFHSAEGLCVAAGVGESFSNATCGLSPFDRTSFSGFGTSFVGADEQVLSYAVMGEAVRTVRVETGAETVDARVVSLSSLGLPHTAMAVLLPAGREPTAIEAFDASGTELRRLELHPPP